MNKNVTISLTEETARWARIQAAEKNTSVSKLVGQMLEEKMRMSDSYWRSYADWKQTMAEIKATGSGIDASQRWSREETHERRR